MNRGNRHPRAARAGNARHQVRGERQEGNDDEGDAADAHSRHLQDEALPPARSVHDNQLAIRLGLEEDGVDRVALLGPQRRDAEHATRAAVEVLVDVGIGCETDVVVGVGCSVVVVVLSEINSDESHEFTAFFGGLLLPGRARRNGDELGMSEDDRRQPRGADGGGVDRVPWDVEGRGHGVRSGFFWFFGVLRCVCGVGPGTKMHA